MQRTITVKGIGKASAKPDTIVITISVDSRDKIYDKAMELAAENNDQLTEAFAMIGFQKELVKTTNFNVRAEYTSVKDRNGTFHQEFAGYVVTHGLRLQFDLDMKLLSSALSALSSCPAHPQITLSFTVKDVAALNEEMLRSACSNARCKAEILCESSGVSLGDLIAIDYNWGELDIYSHTRYDVAEECLAAPMCAKSVDIEPEDIDVSDTVTFVWEIR